MVLGCCLSEPLMHIQSSRKIRKTPESEFASQSEVLGHLFINQLLKNTKHTTVRIRWWSPTQLLTHRRVA
jgi:hypothetical protein